MSNLLHHWVLDFNIKSYRGVHLAQGICERWEWLPFVCFIFRCTQLRIAIQFRILRFVML